MSSKTNQSAETRYRIAFDRLKAGKSLVLPPGSPVSQNNVAKEAGHDPSALRKERYPSLIREIQAYVDLQEAQEEKKISKRQTTRERQEARLDIETRLEAVTEQRDAAQSKVLAAQARVVELYGELRAVRERLARLTPSQPTFNPST